MNAYRFRNDLQLTRKAKARVGRLLLSLSPETADAVHRRPYSKELGFGARLIRNAHLYDAMETRPDDKHHPSRWFQLVAVGGR